MAGGESGSVRVLKLRDSLEHLENWLRGHPNTSLTEPLFPGLEPFEAENALRRATRGLAWIRRSIGVS